MLYVIITIKWVIYLKILLRIAYSINLLQTNIEHTIMRYLVISLQWAAQAFGNLTFLTFRGSLAVFAVCFSVIIYLCIEAVLTEFLKSSSVALQTSSSHCQKTPLTQLQWQLCRPAPFCCWHLIVQITYVFYFTLLLLVLIYISSA